MADIVDFNLLESLEFVPINIEGYFTASHNLLTHINYFPENVSGVVDLSHNKDLKEYQIISSFSELKSLTDREKLNNLISQSKSTPVKNINKL